MGGFPACNRGPLTRRGVFRVAPIPTVGLGAEKPPGERSRDRRATVPTTALPRPPSASPRQGLSRSAATATAADLAVVTITFATITILTIVSITIAVAFVAIASFLVAASVAVLPAPAPLSTDLRPTGDGGRHAVVRMRAKVCGTQEETVRIPAPRNSKAGTRSASTGTCLPVSRTLTSP